MIFWGSGSEVLRIRDAGSRECPVCRKVCPFWINLRYEYLHVYYLFGIATKRVFLLVCERCGNAWQAPAEEIADGKSVARKAIPFLHRWGCLIFLLSALSAATVFFGIVLWRAEQAHQQRQEQQLPQKRLPGAAKDQPRP